MKNIPQRHGQTGRRTDDLIAHHRAVRVKKLPVIHLSSRTSIML